MKFIVYVACGLALGASSIPAIAEVEQRRTVVSYRDLNLANQEGAAALERRVKRAIRRVCGDAGIEPMARLHQRTCVKQATLDTDKQVAKAIEDARVRVKQGSVSPER